MQSLPAPGSLVVIRNQRWRVDRALRHGPIVEIGAGGTTFFVPFDRVAAVSARERPRRVRRQRWLARVAHAFATAESFDLPLAACAAGIDILSHQLAPCLAASSGIRRLLVADDVGLGKTIEAGLIIAEAMRRSVARRVLILAPATLCEQWRQELRDRFGVPAMLIDADSLRHMSIDLPRDVNPWSLDGVFLTSIDFIKQPHALAALPEVHWDIVVIDEAHTLCGDSTRHSAGHAIAARARQVVLLTATPHSGDEAAARRLEQLGAINSLGGSVDELVVFRRTRLDIGPGPLRRIRRVRIPLTPAEHRTLDLLAKFDRIARDSASSDTTDATELLLAVLNKRALSTFGALVLSIDRRLAFLDGQTPTIDADQLSLSFGDDDDGGVSVRIGLGVDRERSWLRRMRGVAIAAAASETKVARLRALISRTSEPAIVFTEFRDSLFIVERALAGVASLSVAHGAVAPRLIADALDAFQSGRSRVLIATDVASQGLNLQHRCRWVIHFDRPWNPVRLEQRAGRVDRLGQVRDVHVTELMTSHDREFELAARVGRRAQAAATSVWLRPSDQWARRARAAARVLHARRRLGAQWAHVGCAGARVPWCTGARRAYGCLRALSCVEIRDGDGRVREQVLSWGADASPGRAMAKAGPRLRRLARLEGERADRAAAVSRALGARERPSLTQLMLPGTGPGAPWRSQDKPVDADIAESTAAILSASPPRLIAFELD